MDGLAERAGLGKGTVFRRFGTRAGIFAALLDDDERAFQEQVLTGPPPLGPGAPPVDRLIAYGRARIDFLIGRREIARAALDGGESVPAGSQTPMSREHIRFLLGEMSLDAADLDVLATQLTAALDGPAAALPVVRHPYPGRSASLRTPRPGLAGPDPARLPVTMKQRPERRRTPSGRWPAMPLPSWPRWSSARLMFSDSPSAASSRRTSP
jgi:AcrR family transcriptional regulator